MSEQPAHLKRKKVEPTPLQQEITRIRAIPENERNEAQRIRLTAALAEEKRARFLRQWVNRVKKARAALKRVTAMSSKTLYDYSEQEAKMIVDKLTEDIADIKRGFTGAPKEKGLLDI